MEKGGVTFAQALRTARDIRGDTQDTVRRLFDITQQTASGWETGKSAPSWAHARQLADYIGVPLSEVLLLLHAAHTGTDNSDTVPPERIQSIDQKVDDLAQLVHTALEMVNELRRAQ